MIKFFRKIRQNLLSEGNTRKYLKYAFGEIILVVIGILIALQINNWNQNRTFKNELQQILIEVDNDLNQDLLYLNEQIKDAEMFNNNIDNLLQNGDKMPIDSLLKSVSNVHFVTFFIPINFGYNKLNNHSRTDLLPDTLTTQLARYYSSFSNQIMNNTSFEELSMYSLNKFRNYLIEFGFPIENESVERPNDLTNLNHIISDQKFIGILRNTKWNRSIQITGFIEAKKQVKNNLELINNYLSSID